jgi:hypothetical protein
VIRTTPPRRASPEEVAYHEAGHVVIGSRLGLELVEVDVEADREGGHGHTVFRQPAWFGAGAPDGERGRGFVETVITTFLAGTAAEARLAGFENPESSGFDEDAVVGQWSARLGAGAAERMPALRSRAAEMVAEPGNWAAIARLASLLIARRRLAGADAAAAVKGA